MLNWRYPPIRTLLPANFSDLCSVSRGASRPGKTGGMTSMPDLIIGYDEHYFPAAAACAACGEEMPLGDTGPTSAEASLQWFKALFLEHVRQQHSSEDVVQVSVQSRCQRDLGGSQPL